MSSSSTIQSFVYILPEIQTYSWGYHGNDSLAGRMWKRSRSVFKVSQESDDREYDREFESTPYAELWYGSHSNGMNRVVLCNDKVNAARPQMVPVDAFLDENPRYRENAQQPSKKERPSGLSYLLKVLSNKIPLSLQCHPDKKLAENLFSANPDIYRDPNHKPEISIALRDNVEALCGFRTCSEIYAILSIITQTHSLIGNDCLILQHASWTDNPTTDADISFQTDCLKDAFQRILTATKEVVDPCLRDIKKASPAYFQDESVPAFVKDALRVCLRLCDQCPGDAGCLAPFLLNYVVTQPGECLYIRPNVLHAYLNGQIIECMACSDNVVRGGLTPKFKDTALLLDMLDYRPYTNSRLPPTELRLKYKVEQGVSCSPKIFLYDPQLPDFKVYLVTLPRGSEMDEPLMITGREPAILVTLHGSATMRLYDGLALCPNEPEEHPLLVPGHAIMVPCNTGIRLSNLFQSSSVQRPASPPNRLQVDFQTLLEGNREGTFLAVVASGGSTAAFNATT